MPGSLEVIAKSIFINSIVQNRSSAVSMCAHKWGLHYCLFACVCACICARVCVCVCVCVHACACVFMSNIGIYAGHCMGTRYIPNSKLNYFGGLKFFCPAGHVRTVTWLVTVLHAM